MLIYLFITKFILGVPFGQLSAGDVDCIQKVAFMNILPNVKIIKSKYVVL